MKPDAIDSVKQAQHNGKKSMRQLALALLLSTAPLAPALAQDNDWPSETDISIEEAIEIAYGQGIATLREVSFDDGRWDIEGLSADGAEIEFEIDGASGEIVGR